MSDTDLAAQVFALRHIVTGLYANFLRNFSAPLSPTEAAKKLASGDIAGFEHGYTFGPVSDASHVLIQATLDQIDSIWRGIEANLQPRP